MEGLIILALFIIFSIVKQLLEKGKIPLPQEGEKDMPLPRERGTALKDTEKGKKFKDTARSYYPEIDLKEEKKASESLLKEKEKSPSKKRKSSKLKGFEKKNLVQGVVFSEVLGLPRSRKPFTLRQMNKVYK